MKLCVFTWKSNLEYILNNKVQNIAGHEEYNNTVAVEKLQLVYGLKLYNQNQARLEYLSGPLWICT